jgi:hypothetical protein
MLEAREPPSGAASGPWLDSVDLANQALITGGGGGGANDGPMSEGVPAYEGLAVVIDETQMRFRRVVSLLRLTAVPARQPPHQPPQTFKSINQLSRVAPSPAPV